MKILLETSRLILRDFKESDWQAVHTYSSVLDIVRYMDWGPNTEQETKSFIERTLQSQKQLPRTDFDCAIILKQTDQLIGSTGIRISDSSNQSGDFGYILHPNYWGQGLATEAAKKLVEFGQNTLKLHRIWATCRPENSASMRVLEKAGLKREGLLRDNKKLRGQWVSSYLYAICAE